MTISQANVSTIFYLMQCAYTKFLKFKKMGLTLLIIINAEFVSLVDWTDSNVLSLIKFTIQTKFTFKEYRVMSVSKDFVWQHFYGHLYVSCQVSTIIHTKFVDLIIYFLVLVHSEMFPNLLSDYFSPLFRTILRILCQEYY